MRVLLPRAEIAYETVYNIARRFPRAADLVSRYRDRDAVFATSFRPPFADARSFEEIKGDLRIVQVPLLVFPAFHPDMVYVGDLAGSSKRGYVRTALGDSNSALALYGYLSDLSLDETLRLFDGEIYAGLGYTGLWDQAVEGLLSLGRDAAYDLSEDVLRWSRRGAFMHSVNHPKMFVACDLARGLLRKAGIPFDDLDLDSYVADELLLQGSWPIYPEIGERFGIPGGYAFVGPGPRPAVLDLRSFVETSFAAYARHRRAELTCDRVDSWLADPRLGAELRARVRARAPAT